MAGDSTQFMIDMVAKLTGGDASVATLATMGDQMLKAGASANDLERAVKATSAALEDSKATMTATNAAVAEGEARYREAETAADRAAKAVERLNASGKSGDAFAKRQAEAVEKAQAATAALKSEAAALDAVKAKAGAAASQHAALSKGLQNVKGAAEQAAKAEAAAAGSGSLRALGSGLGKIGGPAGDAGRSLFGMANAVKKITGAIGSAGPYVALAVGIVAIATAAAIATFSIAKWGVTMADANRTQSLLAQGIARSVEGGEMLDGTITDLGAVVPQTREELLAMAGDLAKTGLRGKDLSNALEVAAVKAARLKFGPDFAAQMLSLDVQSRRLHDNIAQTFGGLKIEKLLSGFSTLVALFDSSTASGKALKFLFESLFQPVVDGAAGAIPAVERLFLQAEILALKAYIAIKPYRSEIAEVGRVALIGAAIIGGVLAAALTLVAVSIGVTVAGIGAMVYGLYKLEGILFDVAGAIYGAFDSAIEFMTDLGVNMIRGLVNGITGAASAVADAIGGVVTGAIDHAKHLLGIASPSAVFAGLGDFTAQGFAEGVKGGSADAQSALEAMVATPQAKAADAAAGGTSVGGVTVNITVEGRGESDEGLAAKIAAAVRDVFETDALMLGAGEAAT